MLEKRAEYDGIAAHIRIPDDPTGLVFIAPGAAVDPNEPLIQSVRNAYEDRGMATVVADLSRTELITSNAQNVHGNFTEELRSVIDGYMSDNGYVPEKFELAGHSMGGAAVLSLTKDYPVSAITLFDPTPVKEETLQTVDCPATVIVSNVRSFRATGHRMFGTLQQNEGSTLHNIETSPERNSGHRFEGKTQEIEQIIHQYDEDETRPDVPAPKDDLENT